SGILLRGSRFEAGRPGLQPYRHASRHLGENRKIAEEVIMPPETLFERIRTMDVRIWAAIAATLLLIGGVMWVVPTTPKSNSFTFDPARRGISSARSIALDTRIDGNLVDGSDTDFYKIDPVSNAVQLEVRFMNGSTELIPAIRVFDGAANLV